MIEVYDECKKAIANNKCSECNEYYSCYLCDYVEERYQQGRADAIDEYKKKVEFEYKWLFDCKVFNPNVVIAFETLISYAEQLKEQNK